MRRLYLFVKDGKTTRKIIGKKVGILAEIALSWVVGKLCHVGKEDRRRNITPKRALKKLALCRGIIPFATDSKGKEYSRHPRGNEVAGYRMLAQHSVSHLCLVNAIVGVVYPSALLNIRMLSHVFKHNDYFVFDLCIPVEIVVLGVKALCRVKSGKVLYRRNGDKVVKYHPLCFLYVIGINAVCIADKCDDPFHVVGRIVGIGIRHHRCCKKHVVKHLVPFKKSCHFVLRFNPC